MTRKMLFRVGISLLLGLSLVPVTSVLVSAEEITMVVKGTVARDSWDTLEIFPKGSMLEGQPFTLTITFNAPPPVVQPGDKCPASLISGTSANPARAVLTIGKGSYVFGTKPESKWDAYRDTAPGCSGRGVGFHVMEGAMPTTSNLFVTLQGGSGKELRSGADWQSPIPTTKVYGIPNLASFSITRPGDVNHGAGGRLIPESLSISTANANSLGRETDSDNSVAATAAAEPDGGGDAAGENAQERTGGGIVITVKGKVSLGHDDYGIFKVGRNLAGQDFTLVMTISESANHRHHMCGDEADGTSYLGTAKDVPAKAVLTIGNGSFVFGGQPDSSWGAFRGVPSQCMVDKIAMNVKEGIYPQTTLLWVKLQPPPGGKPLNTTIDWHSPLSSSNLDKSPLLSSFGISHPNDYEHSDHGVLIPESMTIAVGDSASSQADSVVPENGAAESSSNAAKQDPESPAATDGNSTAAKPQQSLKDKVRKAIGGWLPKVVVPNQ